MSETRRKPGSLAAAGADPAWVLAGNAAWAALQTLVLDRKTRGYLREHDPKALQQACTALHDAGQQYLVRQGDEASDLCWYCLLPLTTMRDGTTFCRDCRHTGQPVQPQQLPADDDEASGYRPEGAVLYDGTPGSGSRRR